MATSRAEGGGRLPFEATAGATPPSYWGPAWRLGARVRGRRRNLRDYGSAPERSTGPATGRAGRGAGEEYRNDPDFHAAQWGSSFSSTHPPGLRRPSSVAKGLRSCEVAAHGDLRPSTRRAGDPLTRREPSNRAVRGF